MKILQNIKVPTGNILVVSGENGKLECLSLGDYGKDNNIVADFLGLDRKLDKVEHTKLLPLEEKWVITCSTQYGCIQKCNFCDVPNVKFGGNATFNDLINQVKVSISLHPDVKNSKRVNIHWARMGEPTWNENVLNASVYLAGMLKENGYGYHPVVSTMMPNNNSALGDFLKRWLHIKNVILNGDAGLQISINSTSEHSRRIMFKDQACNLQEISSIIHVANGWKEKMNGRKITLNFAIANWEIDVDKLIKLFNPDNYLIKLTPMHKTVTAIKNDIKTKGDYTTYFPYQEIEEKLKSVGYDVLIFIASKEEDESAITCGNAILGGSNVLNQQS